ncbi:MAG: CocE/NonD family hydrolase [Streptosporangiales bacterium]|nr:CocE/NonD family hydrolase [Streptosporangiales bacterium]
MRIDWDVPVLMDDGAVLRADVFRPPGDGRYPVLVSYGPYAKGLPFEEGYPSAWESMAASHPDTVAGTTNKYQNWEVVDPEKWIPDGYVCVRVDSRGCGRSPGLIDHFSDRETRDLYESIEWAGTRDWSNGRVGLTGISYYAMNQWQVASRQPPHLAAICPWEGSSDWYRDATHHGGMVSTFWANWYDMQVKTVQYGLGERGARNPNTGQLVCGDETRDDDELAKSRVDFGAEILAHPLDDTYHRERSPDWSRLTVPLLSAGNWGGQGLHLRGNVEGYVRAATPQKWLEMHGHSHWTPFYTDYGVALQKRFFDHFLKGEDNGWADQPALQLQIRHVDGAFTQRMETAWPIPRTRWTRAYLDAGSGSLTSEAPGVGSVAFDAAGEGVTFDAPAFTTETEVTGPVAARLFVSSTTADADLFLVVRVFAPDGEEVTFQGAIDPHTPVAQGWLRASHRALDEELSEPYRPYHRHDSPQPLTPGTVYEVDVEIWPTCLVMPAGYRLSLSVRGVDYVYPGGGGGHLSNFKNELTGCGPFLHDDPRDRPADPFAGTTTVHTGGAHASYLVLPVIPPV